MKKILVFCFFLFSFLAANSQTKNPVMWQAVYHSTSPAEGEIVITASIEKDWHTYSQRPTTDGPIPTTFTFVPLKQYKLVGKAEESDAHEEFVPAFDAKIFIFTDKAEFRQKIKLTGKSGFEIPLKLEFMSCNDMMCLPPKTIDLRVKVQ